MLKNSMSYVRNRTCKKCKNNPPLRSGYCADCLLKKFNRISYKERPDCRTKILELLQQTPKLTLQNLAFPYEYDRIPVYPSDGLQCQARKMLLEKTKQEAPKNA